VACDSGSDKSFDFTGVPQIIEQTKGIIIEIWDRVIFYRERKHAERVKVIAESLPILSKISEMVEKRAISPEEVEILKRQIVAGSTKFVDSGSMIPELRGISRFDPAQLLTPSPQLLIGSEPDEEARQSKTEVPKTDLRPKRLRPQRRKS